MSNPRTLPLEWLPGRYAVCRLDAHANIPHWADPQTHSFPAAKSGAMLVSITRSDRELSIVIDESLVPADVHAQRNFIAFRIAGTLDFDQVGILSRISSALANANIPILAISTFQTDYVLLPESRRNDAAQALRDMTAWGAT